MSPPGAGELDAMLAARVKRQRLGETAHVDRLPGRCAPPGPARHKPFVKQKAVVTHPAYRRWPRLTQHLFEHAAHRPAESLVCPRCTFARRVPAWAKVALIGPACPGKTWIMARAPHVRPWGWGCKVCRMAAAAAREDQEANSPEHGNPWARLAVARTCGKTNLIRHAKSTAHLKAVQKYLHQLGLAHGDYTMAPAVEEFRLVLSKSRTGKYDPESPHVHLARKETTISWCLFEALRDQERRCLRAAEAITVNQDGRHGVLQTRYIACTAGMEVRCGLLAMNAGHDSRAAGLAVVLLDAIDRFATPRLPHKSINAFRRPRPPPVPDQKLCDTIRRAVFAFNADKAADEQLAGRLLQPGSGRVAPESEIRLHLRGLPNLRFVLFDKAHAAQRLQKRTWQKDPVLWKWCELVLTGHQAITHQINSSHVLQARYKHHVDLLKAGFPTNIGWRAHRWDSVRRPLARLLFNFSAVLNLADEVVRLQSALRGDGVLVFRRFLAEIDEEGVLLLGMLADSAEECMQLTRFLDDENFDAAAVASHIDHFRGTIKALFCEGLCLTTGYTKHVLKFLACPKVIICGGKPRTLGALGGAPPRLVQSCLARMQNWVRAAEAVLEAEFPKFDELLGFSCFSLAPPGGRPSRRGQAGSTEPEDLDHERCVRMLARVAGVAAEPLAAQLAAHKAVAVQASRRGGAVRDAWRQAYRATQRDSRRQARYPVDALKPALVRYLAWPGSTSRVEQDFSRLKRLLGEQSHPQGDHLLRRSVLATTTGQTAKQDDELIARARIIWGENFRPPRHRQHRAALRLRLKCPARAALTGEAAWQRQRRRAVVKQRQAPSPAATQQAAAAARLALTLWTEGHSKEVAFNKQKLQDERNERHMLNKLLPEDKPSEKEYQQFLVGLQRRQQQYLAAQRRHTSITALPQVPLLPGACVFIDKAAACCFKGPAAVVAALKARQLRQVLRPQDADVWVVPDPASPPRATLWCAVLRGGLLCTPEFLQGLHAPAIKYKRALDFTRIIWTSPSFRVGCLRMLEAWRHMAQTSSRQQRWRFIASWDDWHDLWLKKRAVQHEAEVIALLSLTDRGADSRRLGLEERQFQQYKQIKARHKLTQDEFLASIRHIDRTGSSQGIGPR